MLWSVNHYIGYIHKPLLLGRHSLFILRMGDLGGVEMFLPSIRMTLEKDITRSSIGV